MVDQALVESMTQRALTEEDQLIQTLILHRTHPALDKGDEIERLGWQSDRFNPCVLQDGIKCIRELGVSVTQEEFYPEVNATR